MRYADLPTFWKRQVSGSMNTAIAKHGTSMAEWLADRFKREGDCWSYRSGAAGGRNPPALEVSEALYAELKEIYVSRWEKHQERLQEKREHKEQREQSTSATEKQRDYIGALMQKNVAEVELVKPIGELSLGEAKRIISFLLAPYAKECPVDLLRQLKPIERGRVYQFPINRSL